MRRHDRLFLDAALEVKEKGQFSFLEHSVSTLYLIQRMGA